MKRLTLVMTLVGLVIWSCDDGDDSKVKVHDQLVGHWEYIHARVGSEIHLVPGSPKYDFHSNMTFIKNYLTGLLDEVRDEGTWTYLERDKTLTLTYKTYTQQVSDTQTKTFVVDSITDDELVLKAEYNDTNISGEFVEFQYVHYRKK